MTTNYSFYAYQAAEIIQQLKPFPNLSDLWVQSVQKYAPLPAVSDGEMTISYQTLDQEIGCFRSILKARELHLGDRVCIMADQSKDFIKAFLAVVTSGLTAVILPNHLMPEAILGCVRMFNAKALILNDDQKEKMAPDIRDQISVIGISENGGYYENALTDFPGSQIALIMFTGGTSGSPKGALLSHHCVMEGIINGCYGYQDVFNQKYLLVLPLFHVFGLIRGVLTPLYTGSEIVICREPKKLYEMMMKTNPTITVLVPLLVERGVALSQKTGKNMFGSKMRYIITGAAPIAPHLGRECARLGITLCPGYGLTETACLVSGNPDMIRKPDSVGLLFPNQEVRFVDGELQLRGKNLFSGYTTPSDTEQAFEDGWFKTGDIARLDEEGFLYILGRKKEMLLLSNGENIYPAEIEVRFNVLDGVQESQLFVSKNESGQDILTLEVVPRDLDGQNDDLMDQLNQINATLPHDHQAKKIILRTEDFQRTASMKMIRYEQH